MIFAFPDQVVKLCLSLYFALNLMGKLKLKIWQESSLVSEDFREYNESVSVNWRFGFLRDLNLMNENW